MLSVIIITKNEEYNIRRCLEALSFADEIIVLDSGSTDKTVELAKQFTDKVYVNDDWQGYGVQKQRALAYATGDWVLNIDADEWVDEKLKEALIEAMKSKTIDAYRIPIIMVFYDKPLRFSSSPTRHIRLFKREGAKYSSDLVHEKILLNEGARVGQLKTGIHHRSYRDLHQALAKLNKYSSYSASMRSKKKPKPFSFVLLNTAWMFFRCYVLKLGFLDGKAGFFMASFQATGTYYRGMKQIYPDV